MNHPTTTNTTHTGRWVGALGATGLLALALAAPADARPDPGTGGLHERSSTSQDERLQDALPAAPAAPAPAAPAVPAPARVTPAGTGSATAYLQLGAGVLAGLALAGAGAVVVSRRHHHTHPASA